MGNKMGAVALYAAPTALMIGLIPNESFFFLTNV